jgi:hypothetical protein
MSDKLEVPRRKVHKNWHVGLNPDPVDRSHPDVHDDVLEEEAMAMKSSTTRKFLYHIGFSTSVSSLLLKLFPSPMVSWLFAFFLVLEDTEQVGN